MHTEVHTSDLLSTMPAYILLLQCNRHVCVVALHGAPVTSSFEEVGYVNCTNRGHDYVVQTCFETVLNLRIDFICPLVDLI